MSIRKAFFTVLDPEVPGVPALIPVQYNPREHSEQYGASFNPQKHIAAEPGAQEFATTDCTQLSMELIFDTTHDRKRRSVRSLWVDPLRRLTQPLVPNTDPDAMDKMRPPLVKFVWGEPLLVGHVNSVSPKYTLYSEEGTPLRARVQVTMVESKPARKSVAYGPLTHLSGDKVRLVVSRAGTLSAIAFKYGVSLRDLLMDNPHIVDPMDIPAGMVLLIVRRRTRRGPNDPKPVVGWSPHR